MQDLPEKDFWFDVGSRLDDAGFMASLAQSSATGVVLGLHQAASREFPSRWTIVARVDDASEALKIPDVPSLVIASADAEVLRMAQAAGAEIAVIVHILDDVTFYDSIARLKQWSAAGAKYGIIYQKDETNIPLEQVLAMKESITMRIVKAVRDTTDADVTLGVLEHGSDGVFVLEPTSASIEAVDEIVRKRAADVIALEPLTVTRVMHVGMGDRACVDVTENMTQSEGMIVGSTSSGGIFVCSETHYLPYMELRPFRVNAGAVHSYVWAPDGRTRYLSELRAGSEVLIVDTQGGARRARVGRSKVERRPLILIEARSASGTIVNAFVQDDWHVRVMGAGPKVMNVSRVKEGDQLLGHVGKPGRHVGFAVDEHILEQ